MQEMGEAERYSGENVLFQGTYKKWRKLLMRTNVICAAVIFVTEVCMFFVFQSRNLFLQPVPVYLFRFLWLPTLVDAAILAGGYALSRMVRGNQRAHNFIPIIQLTLMAFMVSTIHHVFAVTFCTFCFPVFLTVIFSDRRMTAWTTALGLVLLTVAQWLGPIINDVSSVYLVPQYFVAVIALLCANIVCSVLARFQDEKNQTIERFFQRQVEMVDRLNLDQKTGLYGSTVLQNQLRQMVGGAEGKARLALAIFDIDNFKQVNDTYGHAKGDEVLLKLAELMKEICGKRYMPVRFGGEEFAVIFTNADCGQYYDLTERLRVEFSQLRYSFTDRSITLSAGLAIWHSGWSDAELFDQADKAMYRAKQSGKNRTCVNPEGACAGAMYAQDEDSLQK